MGDQLEIDCLIEAFPKPTNYWSRKPAPTRSNDAAVISTGDYDNAASEPSSPPRPAGPRVPKRKQMAIYEQVTTQQPQISDNGFITAQPTTAVGAASLSGSDKLLDAAEAAPLAKSPRQQQQYIFDKDTHKDNARHRKQHINYPSNELIRHDFQRRLRLKRRQVVMPIFSSDLDSAAESESVAPVDGGGNITSAYVTVKQTAMNSYTYRLRLTIDRVQADDFGGYVCISSNALGSSQEYLSVTSKLIDKRDRWQIPFNTNLPIRLVGADRSAGVEKSAEPNGEIDYQRDSLVDSSPRHNQAQASSPLRNRHAANGNARVYGEWAAI